MKPADFFIGVMAFFAILMPGALLVYLLLATEPGLGAAVLAPFQPAGEVVKWAAFAVAAYLSGHLLHHLGSILDDWYDRGYARHKRRFGDERLLRDARALLRSDLGGDIEGISTFEWAGSWVRAHSDAAGAELEHAGADSKFFRSLCIVAAIGVPVFVVRFELFAAAGCVALSWFSYRRFCKRRWDAAQRTYEYYVMLRREKGSGSAAAAAAAAAAGGDGAPARATTTAATSP
jgi:hypothetical protein